MSPFTVTVGSVHGPLETVLELVEKRKLFVNDVSLAQITDEYVAFVQNNALPVEERASFVAVASALLLLKARSLLPSFTFTHDEELQVSDLRRDLERYAYFRKVARQVEKVWGTTYVPEQKKDGRKLFTKQRHNAEMHIFAPGEDVTKEHILFALQSILHALPSVAPRLQEVAVRSIKSIEEVVTDLIARVSKTMRASFSETVKNSPKEEVIVYFLGMLELVKRGVLEVEQHEKDGILMQQVSGGVMHVG